jgi:hypothetical protein
MKKICNKCNIEKDILCFHNCSQNSDGHKHICKTCRAKESKLRYEAHRDELIKYQKIYRDTHGISQKHELYVKNYMKSYRKRDYVKIANYMRTRVWKALHGMGSKLHFNEYIGCPLDEFMRYIESKFQIGMTWENYGYWGWHIDHIIPCFAFDLTDLNEFKKCFHYTNLQPLWRKDNLSKHNKIIAA